VTIELKNDLCITGTLKSVDQFLNIKLDEIRVKDEQKYPHLVCFIAQHFYHTLKILDYI
jgi:U6 snRNA-associated Sm-like protein LSm2